MMAFEIYRDDRDVQTGKMDEGVKASELCRMGRANTRADRSHSRSAISCGQPHNGRYTGDTNATDDSTS
jgi:hypothetical protein